MADETTTKEEIKTEDAGKEFEVPDKFKDMIESVKQMSVLELHELVKTLEGVFGVSASAVAVAGPGAGAGEAEEEKSAFTVVLTDIGAQKIAVIKVVKEALSLGLKEAKDMVESAPVDLAKDMKKEDAEALKAKVEGAGGKVELK
jgi:large subunit ribosomal protein L7/L12